MAITTSLAACSTNPSLNGPDGSDLPSVLDNALRYALSFIAELRDGAGIPTGAMFTMTGAAVPVGFIKANGVLLSRVTYANLFAYATASGLVSEAAWAAGSHGCYSVGDGSTTFRVPDTRGELIRALDDGRGIDVGRALGTFQAAAVLAHTHTATSPAHGHGVNDSGHIHTGTTTTDGNHTHVYQASNSAGFGTGVSGAIGLLMASQVAAATTAAGSHNHTFTANANGTGISIQAAAVGVTVQNQGIADGRPRNLAYPMVIKY